MIKIDWKTKKKNQEGSSRITTPKSVNITDELLTFSTTNNNDKNANVFLVSYFRQK